MLLKTILSRGDGRIKSNYISVFSVYHTNIPFTTFEAKEIKSSDPAGKVIYKNVLGKTQVEVKEKLTVSIKETQSLDLQKLYKKLLTKGRIDHLEAKG